jgi:hypothetical protein
VYKDKYDGIRAPWDQDLIGMCARSVRAKIEVVAKTIVDKRPAVAFSKTNTAAYYVTKPSKSEGRKMVSEIKTQYRAHTAARKIQRIRKYATTKNANARISRMTLPKGTVVRKYIKPKTRLKTKSDIL